MITAENKPQIPVVASQLKDGKTNVFIPDLNITIHDVDFISALAKASMTASALYYYNLERNVIFDLKTKYADAEKLCDDNSFVTFICLTN